jgi:hypothetical protein
LATDAVERPEVRAKPGAVEPPRAGPILAAWMALFVLLNALLWLSGLKGYVLAEAIERGAARAETAGIGETTDDAIRKAVRIQQDTLPFWRAVTGLGDFLFGPAALAVRALVVATLFSGLAALVGRPVRFPEGLVSCASAQGWWVLGLAFQAALMVALRRPEVETSATLLLPAGTHSAVLWIALSQLDLFAALGWGSMALGGWRRGQVNLLTAAVVCGVLWACESAVRIGAALVVGAGMRLALTAG